MFKSLVTRLKTTNTGLFLLLNIQSIYQTYKMVFRNWWRWLLPVLLVSALVAHEKLSVVITNSLTLIFFLAVWYGSIRPSVQQIGLSYFWNNKYLFGKVVFVLVEILILFGLLRLLFGFILLPVVFFLGMPIDSNIDYAALAPFWLSLFVYVVAFASLIPFLPAYGLHLLNPLYAFIALAVWDRMSIGRSFSVMFHIARKNYVWCVIVHAGTFFIAHMIGVVLQSSGFGSIFGFDMHTLFAFLLMPLTVVWVNMYVRTVYGDPASSISSELR